MSSRHFPRRRLMTLLLFVLFILPLIARAALYAVSDDPRSWHDADWSSTGLLPAATDYQPARVIMFTGKAGAWKGIFAVHSWVVFKRPGAREWTRYDVVSAGAIRCAPMAGRLTASGTATSRWCLPISPAPMPTD